MPEIDESCRFLEWDSNFFQKRIAQSNVACLTELKREEIRDWCRRNAIDCLYFLADPDDGETVRLLEDDHFRFVDIRLTLKRGLRSIMEKPIEQNDVISLFVPDDLPELRRIAGMSHRLSRFYFDSNFPRALCDSLYETWIEKSCKGYADCVLVARLEKRPVGYVSCHKERAQIGLVGLDESAQGRGLGKKLVKAALEWFVLEGVNSVTVVTQGRNQKAIRLYERSGFTTDRVQLWYHRWFQNQ